MEKLDILKMCSVESFFFFIVLELGLGLQFHVLNIIFDMPRLHMIIRKVQTNQSITLVSS